jgi:toxin YoeB
MEIRFSENGWEDYLFWQERDKKVVRKINFLLNEISRDPYSGPGHPERLRYDLA